MAREKNSAGEISALRADIAALVRSVERLEAEVNETRGTLRRTAKGHSGNGNGNGHVADELMAGAMKLGGTAAEAAGEAVHASASWVDDILRKNPTPAVLTALGIGFVL